MIEAIDIRHYDLRNLTLAERNRLMRRAELDLTPFLAAVGPIVEDVRREGDAALIRYARRFDGAPADFSAIASPPEDTTRAFAELDPAVIAALRFAADNIRRFHQRQLPHSLPLTEMAPGVKAGEIWSPIDSVACYVPRGKGSFPSVALMTAIPAILAGVKRVIMLSPPGADGRSDAATLVAAHLAGVGEVYRIGGAQAVAAAAFGTASVPAVRKIVGPGSPYLMAAKRLLADRIDPGAIAGPSETIVFADESADGALVALDFLIEIEHGPDSSGFLVTISPAIAAAAAAAIPDYLAQLPAERVAFIRRVLGSDQGGIVLAPDLAAAYDFINDYAPEHLMIHSGDPHRHLPHIRNAGEILLGEMTSNTLANFVIGPNNVLPTHGWAKTMSPLSVLDFMKRTTIAEVSPEGYRHLAPAAECLARYEGFAAHALAVGPMRDRILAARRR